MRGSNCGCTVWSALLFACNKIRFSRERSNIYRIVTASLNLHWRADRGPLFYVYWAHTGVKLSLVFHLRKCACCSQVVDLVGANTHGDRKLDCCLRFSEILEFLRCANHNLVALTAIPFRIISKLGTEQNFIFLGSLCSRADWLWV